MRGLGMGGFCIEHTAQFWADWFGPIEAIDQWHFTGYEYIDDLSFMPNAREVLRIWPDAEALLTRVETIWRSSGWDGDGDTQLLWLPPFVFRDYEPLVENVKETLFTPAYTNHIWTGYYALHVKQLEDGLSWLASPKLLPNFD